MEPISASALIVPALLVLTRCGTPHDAKPGRRDHGRTHDEDDFAVLGWPTTAGERPS
jgi:hypothetical protein